MRASLTRAPSRCPPAWSRKSARIGETWVTRSNNRGVASEPGLRIRLAKGRQLSRCPVDVPRARSIAWYGCRRAPFSEGRPPRPMPRLRCCVREPNTILDRVVELLTEPRPDGTRRPGELESRRQSSRNPAAILSPPSASGPKSAWPAIWGKGCERWVHGSVAVTLFALERNHTARRDRDTLVAVATDALRAAG